MLQPAIEEQLRRCQHHGTVDIVLALLPGIVAHAHGAHAAIAGKSFHLTFGRSRSKVMPNTGPISSSFFRGHHVENVAYVFLHRAVAPSRLSAAR
jgi:hypothetical protein